MIIIIMIMIIIIMIIYYSFVMKGFNCIENIMYISIVCMYLSLNYFEIIPHLYWSETTDFSHIYS